VRNNKIGWEDFHFENWTDCQVSFREMENNYKYMTCNGLATTQTQSH